MDLHSHKIKNITIKLMYFISFAAFSSWLSYFNVYLKEVPRLTGFEIGILAALQQFNTIFIVPVWGMLADKYGRKKMLAISLFLSIFMLLLFMINTSFIYYILFVIFLTSVYNPLNTLLDSIGLDFEEESGRVSFGEIRLWGSIGWAISSFATGYFINTSKLIYIFPIASSLLLITFLITTFIYKPLTVQSGIQYVHINQIKQLLSANRNLLNFFLIIFVFAMFAAPTYLFINMYYNEIGASNTQIGIAYAVQAMCELPFFFYGKRIVKKTGAKNLFILVMTVTAARMIFYGLNSNPWLAIAAGPFQGFSISLFIIATIDYIHKIIPSEYRSTGQSLFYTFYAAGICFGNLIAGYMKDILSIRDAMIINAFAISALIIYMLIRKRISRIRYH